MTAPVLLTAITPNILQDLLWDAGFRVEMAWTPAGAGPSLCSTSPMVAFDFDLFDPLPGDASHYAGFSLRAGLLCFPSPQFLKRWNVDHSGTCLFQRGDLLILSKDVILAGGASRDQLRTLFALWDCLVQELISWLCIEPAEIAFVGTQAKGGPSWNGRRRIGLAYPRTGRNNSPGQAWSRQPHQARFSDPARKNPPLVNVSALSKPTPKP